MATTQKPNFSELLHQAVDNLDEEIAALQNTRAQLLTLINQPTNGLSFEAPIAQKRHVRSAATRKKLSEAAKARWERVRREKTQKIGTASKKTQINQPASGSSIEHKRRELSPAGRKRISEAVKARWERSRKANSQKMKAAGKKHSQQKGRHAKA